MPRVLLEVQRKLEEGGGLDPDPQLDQLRLALAAWGFTLDADRQAFPSAPAGAWGAFGISRPRSLYVRGAITSLTPPPHVLETKDWRVLVFSDPVIGVPPVGAAAHATTAPVQEELLEAVAVQDFDRIGADGRDVAIAVVDTGINIPFIRDRLPEVRFDAANSVSTVDTVPGDAPVGHGTMCAYDAILVARSGTLIDLAGVQPVIKSTSAGLASLLSDVLQCYELFAAKLPALTAAYRALVVTNSWAVFDPTDDFPPEHPGNYVVNPNHPFNRCVADLDAAHVDVLFSAGNCGVQDPMVGCHRDGQPGAIYGANSHAAVLTVTAFDLEGSWLPFSSEGPGRLHGRKPDVGGYCGFRGSQAQGPTDTFTSAACAVVAGLVARVRTVRPAYGSGGGRTPAAQVRDYFKSTSAKTFSFESGHGVVDGKALAAGLEEGEGSAPALAGTPKSNGA